MILNDMITEKAGDGVPGIGHFYDHAQGDTVWGQDLIYAFYADDKIAYPLIFRLYEQQDHHDQGFGTKYDLAREIVTELEDHVGVPRMFGVLLHSMRLSLREVAAVLELLGVNRSHGAVWNWTHDLAVAQADPPTV